MEYTVSQIAALIGGKIEGDGDQKINTISPIEQAKPGSISFLSNPKYESYIYKTEATAVIVNDTIEFSSEVHTTLIKVDNAYTSFTALLEEYQKFVSFQKEGIEQPCFIHESAAYGSGIYVGAFAYIGEKTVIGKNCKIYPNAYIGDGVTIGDNTIIHPGAKVHSGTVIGNHCVLQAGAVVGSDGFGFAPQADGTYKPIPQVGKVVLEDFVNVGANTVIDCATFDATIVRKGVKLDNLIQVAHNVEIGENTVIAAQAGIAGSAKIGRNCVIGGQVGVAGHIKIADKVQIQAQSGVSKAPKEGSALFGSPAIEYGNYVRSYTVFRQLPEVLKKIQEIEQNVLSLSKNSDK
jgi:UDP-3-O-[3-hydroxymyristoyl] glucosamine N-acyltransferase